MQGFVVTRPSSRRVSAVLTAVLVLIVMACSVPKAPSPTATPVPPTLTPEPPTHTPAPSPVPPEDDGVWDYLALGDCVFGGDGAGLGKSYPNVYAAYIAEDTDVEVKLHNRCAFAEKTTSLLGKLQGDETIRQEVSDAEVITIWVGSLDIFGLIYGEYQGEESPRCGPIGEMDMDCVREAVQVQEDNLDAILAEILSLRGTDEALIRIADGCDSYVEQLKEAGAFEQLDEPIFAHWTRAISDLAAKHGVMVVHTHAACNGPDGDEAIPAEYRHPNPIYWYLLNEAGHATIADLHRAVGYERGP